MEDSLLKWVNMFDLPREGKTLADLSDGTLLNEILAKVSPTRFQSGSLKSSGDLITKINNIKTLWAGITEYLKESTGVDFDSSQISVSAIADGKDKEAIIKLVEFVLYASVVEAKESALQKITDMDDADKTAISSILTRFAQGDDRDDDDDSDSRRLSGSQRPFGASVSHLHQLQEQIKNMETDRSELLRQLAQIKNENKEYQNRIHNLEQKLESTEKKSKDDIAKLEAQMQSEKDELSKQQQAAIKRLRMDYETKLEELDNAKKTLERTLETATKKYAQEINQLKAEKREQMDQIDLFEPKRKKLHELEQENLKLKRKLDGFADIDRRYQEAKNDAETRKNSNNRLESDLKFITEKNSKYQQRIVELESEVKELHQQQDDNRLEISRLETELKKKAQESSSRPMSRALHPSIHFPASPESELPSKNNLPEMSSLQKEHDELYTQFLEVKEANKKFDYLIQQKEKEIKKLTEDKKKLEAQLKEEREKSDLSSREELDRLERENKSLNQKIEVLQQNLSAEKKVNEQKAAEVSKKVDTMKSFQMSNLDLEKRCRELDEQLKIAREEVRLVTSAFYSIGTDYLTFRYGRGESSSARPAAEKSSSFLSQQRLKASK